MTNRRSIPPLSSTNRAHEASSLAAALRGVGEPNMAAPGHPFDASTGSGIQWSATALERWANGERVDVATVRTSSPRACWDTLAFVDAFPNVTHWWFGSAWTQRVRVTTMASAPDGGRYVWVQPVQEDADELLWTVGTNGHTDGPSPTYADHQANVPLQLRLGALVRQATSGNVRVGVWYGLTSLVAAPDLARLLAGELRTRWLHALGIADAV